MLSWTGVLLAAAAALLAALCWSWRRQGYWRRRGVPSPAGMPLVGNFYPVMTGSKSYAQHLYDIAENFREVGYCGVDSWGQPMLLVFDPEMVKQILCKDFSSFHDRGFPVSESDPLSQNLINLSGGRWRHLRNRLSPAFTSGKLKLMFPLMLGVGERLSETLAAEAQRGDGELDVAPLLYRFVADLIGTVAFGVDCNCLADEQAEFLAMSRSVFSVTPAQMARFVLLAIHPKLGALLPFKLVYGKVHRFFMDLMRDTVRHREAGGVVRNDFIDTMIQARGRDEADADHIELTTDVMAAQGFVFFVAGLENVSNTVAFLVHRLAQDAALQQRLADEVREAVAWHGGELTMEALKEMELAERVVQEGLRVWSPAGLAMRKCNRTTRVGDLVVEEGTSVMVVSHCMHTDPTVFPEPGRFDPDRHTAEARQSRHPYSFIPFGEGPRVCIGERLALLEMKLALVLLVRDFAFAPGPRFEPEPAKDPKAFFPRPLNGFLVRAQRRAPQGENK